MSGAGNLQDVRQDLLGRMPQDYLAQPHGGGHLPRAQSSAIMCAVHGRWRQAMDPIDKLGRYEVFELSLSSGENLAGRFDRV